MDNNKYEILENKSLYQGFAHLVRYKLRHIKFNGEWSQPFYREVSLRYKAVAVLPYDPKLDKVVLIEQFRAGALENKSGPWLLELVAGVIDREGSKEEFAQHETKEEAGLDIVKLIPITEYWSSPGGSSEFISLYCGIVDASNAGGVHGLADENEDILVHVMSSQEAFAKVRSGEINNAFGIIALQWLELNLPLKI
jgi:ADP-ribose pyrophosphatase